MADNVRSGFSGIAVVQSICMDESECGRICGRTGLGFVLIYSSLRLFKRFAFWDDFCSCRHSFGRAGHVQVQLGNFYILADVAGLCSSSCRPAFAHNESLRPVKTAVLLNLDFRKGFCYIKRMSQEQPKKQPAPEYVSIKQAEETEKQRQETLGKMRQRISKVAEKLKNEGYKFEMEETDEYLIKTEDRTTHLLKLDSFPLESKDKLRISVSLEEMIEASIRNPKENSYAAVLELRKQKNESNN